MNEKGHDRTTICLAVVLAATTIFMSFHLAFCLLASFLFSGFMFNGDLDCWSAPTRRWGILHWLWWPYRKICKHRGASHWPVVGTLGRLLYVSPVLILLFPFYKPEMLEIFFILAGLELGALSHIMADEM